MQENIIVKILNFFKKLLSGIAIVFSCFIIIFLLANTIITHLNSDNEDYVPFISLYTIVSPSMTPVIDVYDVVVNVKISRPENIEVGDIITFKSKSSLSQGMTITHRVIEIKENINGQYEYVTQGDNNSEPDDGTVKFENVIGKEICIIPKLGNLQFLLSSYRGWIFLILIPIALLIIKDIFKLIDLFGLNNRVNKVITEKEDKEKKLREEERKEEIKERLGLTEGKILKPSNVEYNQILNKKIEEYNTKIAELDKMIIEMEQGIKPNIKKEEKEEKYLKGGKIKIVKSETAKKKKDDIQKKDTITTTVPKEQLKTEETKKTKKIIGIEKRN